MKHYECKNFKLHEFVSRDVKSQYGLMSWQFLDPRLLYTADMIREHFGVPMTINNWYWKIKRAENEEEIQEILAQPGVFDQRGFRSHWCKEGKTLSQHRFGRAIDYDIQGIPSSEVRKEIIKNQHLDRFRFISVIEADVNWNHNDIRQMAGDSIYLIPKK